MRGPDSFETAANRDGSIDVIIMLDRQLFYDIEKALDYLVDLCGFTVYEAANYLTLLRREYETRAAAWAVAAEHPAFIANICGTLIDHPAHDGVSRWFSACPECARAYAPRAVR